jgi:hypothetical protein
MRKKSIIQIRQKQEKYVNGKELLIITERNYRIVKKVKIFEFLRL